MRLKLPRRGNATGIPNLVVARRVVMRMVSAAQRHIEDETGEALVGLIVQGDETGGVPTIYVLDTISPDDSALRLFHTFQQGDERQDELIWWLQENWRLARTSLTGTQKKFDVPLRYLGDWHKQPGFMIAPSDGDLYTALDWIDDDSNGMNFLLAPIVTLSHPHTTAPAGGNFLVFPNTDGTAMRVDFWYIDEDNRVFAPITPVEYPNEQLPALAAYPWHLLDDTRFRSETGQLEAAGFFVSVILWDADGNVPLEVCLLTARVGSEHLLIIVTPFDYPASPPVIRVAPFIHMKEGDDMYDVFSQAWTQSEPTPQPVEWKPEEGLIGMIRAVEGQLGVKLPENTAQMPPVSSEIRSADATSGGVHSGDDSSAAATAEVPIHGHTPELTKMDMPQSSTDTSAAETASTEPTAADVATAGMVSTDTTAAGTVSAGTASTDETAKEVTS